jgi:lipoprotein-releasing system permease protein
MVLERMKTIGILGSMGVSKRRIQLIFLSIGLLIGVTGTLAGIGAGLLSGHLLSKYDVLHLPVDVYWVQGTPFYFPVEHILVLVLFSIIISLAASILPSWWISKQDPIMAIRYG